MKPEVIVLGAGSAGLQAARNILERTNLDILVIEEHARIGYPEHCTGLISLNGVKNALRVPLQNLAVNYIHGAYIYSPSGIRLLVARTEPVAVVINRPLYEYMLYKLVADRVKFVLGVKASLANGKVYFRDTTLKPSFIVDARGLQSLTSRRPEARKHVIPALQFDMSARLEEYKYVHVFLGDQFSKGFFAWAVPLDDNRVRIGLASKGNVLLRLKTLANRLEKITNGIIKPTSRLRVLGGAVYTGGLADQVSGTVYYVGDSAGQTKPTTGGGLVYHSYASLYLAEALAKNSQAHYDYSIRRLLGREIKRQLLLRRLLDGMNDKELNELFLVLKRINGEELVSKYGDMDVQTSLLRKLGMELMKREPLFYLRAIPLLFNLLVAQF